MYQNGISTREIGKFMERILGNAYSPATISRITDVVKGDIEKWHTRLLYKRYSVLYLNSLYIKLRRDTVEKEVIYVVLGMKKGFVKFLISLWEGKKVPMGGRTFFNTSTKEEYREYFLDVLDGLQGLEKAFRPFIRKSMCSALCRS
jgi:putative transposase